MGIVRLVLFSFSFFFSRKRTASGAALGVLGHQLSQCNNGVPSSRFSSWKSRRWNVFQETLERGNVKSLWCFIIVRQRDSLSRGANVLRKQKRRVLYLPGPREMKHFSASSFLPARPFLCLDRACLLPVV